MDQSKATSVVLLLLGLLAVCVTVLSILILRGGKFYHRIPERSRPRRSVVAIFFSYFVLFCFWFPCWLFYPGSIVAHIFDFLFFVFTVALAALFALGRVGALLLPVAYLGYRLIDVLRIRRVARKP